MRRHRHARLAKRASALVMLLLFGVIYVECVAHRPATHAHARHPSNQPTLPEAPHHDPGRTFFLTPSPEGLGPVVDEIDGARSSIRMIMFHLTEHSVVDALLRARARGVDVRLILDAKNLDSRSSSRIARELTEKGVVVTPSSTEFSITHVKAMVIDQRRAVIMSLNLTTLFEKTRDYAVTSEDSAIVAEFDKVFDADITNAEKHTKNTPPLTCSHLMWSPVNAETRLVDLIDSAQRTIFASAENLGDEPIEAALKRAANDRHVKVRILAPLCDLNPNPFYNVPTVRRMDDERIDARLMPGPATPERPYIHAKMMIVDGARGYLGSMNFSENSAKRARELGILFDDPETVHSIEKAYESDWAQAILPPEDTTGMCSSR